MAVERCSFYRDCNRHEAGSPTCRSVDGDGGGVVCSLFETYVSGGCDPRTYLRVGIRAVRKRARKRIRRLAREDAERFRREHPVAAMVMDLHTACPELSYGL